MVHGSELKAWCNKPQFHLFVFTISALAIHQPAVPTLERQSSSGKNLHNYFRKSFPRHFGPGGCPLGTPQCVMGPDERCACARGCPVSLQLSTLLWPIVPFVCLCSSQRSDPCEKYLPINHLGRLLQTHFQKGFSKFCLHCAPWEKRFLEKQSCPQPSLFFFSPLLFKK